jgi:hypothetical protein
MRVLVVMLAMLPACSALLRDDSAKEHPVTKIVNMLKKMQTTLGEEQKKDDEINEKMSCYCDVNDKEKNAAVEAAMRAIDELTVTIEEKSALAAKLATEIEQLEAEMEAAAQAIATATKMREEEHAEFTAEEKELMETIQALTEALGVLGKHNEPALLSVAEHLKAHDFRHLEGMKQRVISMLQQPTGTKSYNARSGEIYGILKTMKEEFEGTLSKTQKEEMEAQKRFEELIAEKKAGIEKARERKNTKVTEKSDAEVALVNAKHDLKNVREGLSADQKFLVDLKLKCASSDKEYEARSKERQEELVAVGEALTILTGDEARDLFGSTLGFLQVKSTTLKLEDKTRSHVVDVLKKAAKKSKSPQLALLAEKAGLDAFVKVKAAIDEMLVELDQQQKDEIAHKRWCDGELRSNEVTTKEKTWAEEDLSKTINVLADTIETLDSDIAALQDAIAEEKRQVKHASEDRQVANKEFQQTVADQRATVVILNKVLKRLQDVYAPGAAKATALLQRRKAMVLFGAPEEPEGFGGDYKKQSSGGVLGLIEMTIADAERLEKETLAAEQVQQTDYEALVKDASAQIAADSETITAKKGEKATAEVSKTEAEASYEGVKTDLANLASYADSLHASCDFVLKNFDLRQKARSDEMAALEDAKAILSGADFQ